MENQYELKTPFQYSSNGDMVDAQFISMSAPSYKQISKIAPVKQFLMQAIKDMLSMQGLDTSSKSEEPAGDDGIDGDTALQIIYSSNGDIDKFFKYISALFESGVVFVDGDTAMTKAIFDKMSMSDFEGLTGAYLANFIAPSLMGGK